MSAHSTLCISHQNLSYCAPFLSNLALNFIQLGAYHGTFSNKKAVCYLIGRSCVSVKNMFKILFIFGIAFTCQAQENNDCLLPKPPKNGYLISDRWAKIAHSEYDPDITKYVREDTSVEFYCDDKYEIEGKKSLFCDQGSFRDEVPVCVKKRCDEPPAIENSYYYHRRYARPVFRKGTSLYVNCAEGYRRKSGSPRIVQCIRVENELKWTPDLPICEKIPSCGDPGTPLNGERVGNSFYVGDTVSFSCGGEDVLVGSEVLTCSHDGVWDNPRPRCRPPLSCPDPPVQDHVRYEAVHQTRDYFIPGDEVNVLCYEGFTIYKGIDSNLCTNKKYDYYEDEENAFALSAEEGNEPIPPFWSESFPKCEEVFCTMPSIPKHGYIKEFGQLNLTDDSLLFKYGYTISYVCKKGYQVIGAHFRECTETGWTSKKPYCRKITCSMPPTPDDGWKNVKMGTDIGDIVQFGCFPGFTLSGAVERECLENGQWSGEPAVCVSESTHCPNPGTPLHGSKFGNKYNLGAEVSFTCDFDYTLIGSPVRQCMPNRVWSGEEVVCKRNTDFERTSALQYRLLSNLNSMVLLRDSKTQPSVESTHFGEGRLPEDKIPRHFGRSLDINPVEGESLVLYFVFDSSRSVGRRNFHRSIDFVKAIVKRIGVSVGGVRVGALSFGHEVDIRASFLPTDNTDTAGVLKNLDNLKEAYSGGGTNIYRALKFIESDVLPIVEMNIKDKIKYHVFLLSDGASNVGGDPTFLSYKMKDAGVKFSCVAISGEKLNLKALYAIASDRKEVYELKDNEELEWIVDVVLNGTVDYSKCGLPVLEEKTLGGRVLGEETKTYWPWMALLRQFNRHKNEFTGLCGGSIIDRDWILTAASCMLHGEIPIEGKLRDPENLFVRLGYTKATNDNNIQDIKSSKIFIHPEYCKLAKYDYDVALIKLSHSADYEKRVRPVCLSPAARDIPDTSKLYVEKTLGWAIGYGKFTNERVKKHEVFSTLREVALKIRSEEECRNDLLGTPVQNYTARMFCAGGEKGKDTCNGDGGGPFMKYRYNADGKAYWIQTGITSFSPRNACGLEGQYGYYTKVATVRDWIDKTIQNN